ncbi:ribosomal protein S18-alanine N-acetyltransferase [Aeromicrobium panaciterrae]|uniref:ribosomal protein S18-alanine N-acetyltransferase n=1 Tax=Aeromicrobium panaciterrae TaxID=363861 RepID=UPI0031DF3133
MIRGATDRDVAAIVTIEAECFGSDAWSEQLVREQLAAEHRIVLVDDPVAYGVVSVLGDVADLDRIAVLPFARRRGVAGGLLEQLIEAAGGHGAERLLLEVAADNDAAIGLYESFGFTTINTRKGYYPRGVDALVMEREIA